MPKKIFTLSERRVMASMFKLGRFATANEIAKWADMSWNTASKVLRKLRKKKIVLTKRINGKTNYIMKEKY